MALIRELGANVLRCYTIPPAWFFDLAAENQLKLFVDIPWNYQLAFLDEPTYAREAMERVSRFAREFGQHPALFATCIANEIPPDVVRWSGARAIGAFLDRVIDSAKSVNEDLLLSLSAYPSTEYLVVQEVDFVCFNVYLHEAASFSNYLARLQSIAGTKPLVIGELGRDSLQSGEEVQAEFLRSQLQCSWRESVAGTFIYSFCDEWFKDGRLVTDWAFGLVRANRTPKPSFGVVANLYRIGYLSVFQSSPKVSVVVAAYNAAETLEACLRSLEALVYRDYEVVVVDDGSTDRTATILKEFSQFRTVSHEVNCGLSAARNSGIAASSGEIVAFTDADCRVDAWWLSHIVAGLEEWGYAGIGGHNLLPHDSNPTAVAVSTAPGGPIHVMVSDRIAEHIPGCNMAFTRKVLEEVGGFDPRFRVAGDDVDLCWRVQQHGHRIGFCAGGFVWHDRRSTVSGYVRQQMGYGRAESQLAQKFPSLFNWLGDHTWRGRIYDDSVWWLGLGQGLIYRGIYGRGLFQLLVQPQLGWWAVLPVSLEYHVFATGGSFLLGWLYAPFWWFSGVFASISMAICLRAGWRVRLPRENRQSGTRLLVAWLYFLQPVVRSFARYHAWGFRLRRGRKGGKRSTAATGFSRAWWETRRLYWVESSQGRVELIGALHRRLTQEGWIVAEDDGFQEFDLAAQVGPIGRIETLSAEEYFPGDRRQIRIRLRFCASRFAWFTLALSIALGCVSLLVLDTWQAVASGACLVLLVVCVVGVQAIRAVGVVDRFVNQCARDLNWIEVSPLSPMVEED